MNDDTSGATGTRMPMAVSETALLLVHLSVVGGFARLYEGTSFIGPLAGFTVAAHLLAVVTRRRHVAAPLVAALAVLGVGLVASWLLFPASMRLGLPTGATWDLAGEALRASRDSFEREAAPAPVTPGFQLASGLALWAAVWFADWAAFRLRATVEAVAPGTVLFVFGAMLGSGEHRFVSAAAFAAATLAFVAGHRAWRAQLDQAWLTTSPVTGPRAVLRAGAGLAVLGLVGGAVVGPRLPGSEAEAVLRWRSETRATGDRTTVSPIVDLRKRLVNQSDTALFTVRADRRAYWRLTSLDRFDGQLWSSGGTFSPADERLGSTSPDLEDNRRNRQDFEIDALEAIWVPTAYKARGLVETTNPLRWDPRSSTLIVEADSTSDGLDYTVVSETPILAPNVLAQTRSDDTTVIEERYEGLPDGFPQVARDAARRVIGSSTNRYEQAKLLQDWFRTEFTYSLDVEPGNGDDALVDFLASREGYCEQFAGAYAAMARSLGIPSRVAVGFTPGDPDPDDPNLYTVRGKHAHAWPELWFPDVGWVPFEPTPGRGLPDAETYTGVPEQQDETEQQVPAQTTTTTVAGGPTTLAGTTAPELSIPRNPTVTAGPEPSDPGGRSGLATALIGAAALVALWLAVLLAAPVVRSRRRRRGGRSASAVLDAWHEGLAPVRWLTGLGPRPAETHAEFSRRAAPPLGPLDNDLVELAALATNAAWDPTGASPTAAARAGDLAHTLVDEAQRRQSLLARLRRRLSWREAFDHPKASAPV